MSATIFFHISCSIHPALPLDVFMERTEIRFFSLPSRVDNRSVDSPHAAIVVRTTWFQRVFFWFECIFCKILIAATFVAESRCQCCQCWECYHNAKTKKKSPILKKLIRAMGQSKKMSGWLKKWSGGLVCLFTNQQICTHSNALYGTINKLNLLSSSQWSLWMHAVRAEAETIRTWIPSEIIGC